MSPIAAWFILVMGISLAAVAVQGILRGWLPNGPNGLKQGNGVFRERNPLGFWFFFSLYFGGGLYVAFYAFRILSGQSTPLP